MAIVFADSISIVVQTETDRHSLVYLDLFNNYQQGTTLLTPCQRHNQTFWKHQSEEAGWCKRTPTPPGGCHLYCCSQQPATPHRDSPPRRLRRAPQLPWVLFRTNQPPPGCERCSNPHATTSTSKHATTRQTRTNVLGNFSESRPSAHVASEQVVVGVAQASLLVHGGAPHHPVCVSQHGRRLRANHGRKRGDDKQQQQVTAEKERREPERAAQQQRGGSSVAHFWGYMCHVCVSCGSVRFLPRA